MLAGLKEAIAGILVYPRVLRVNRRGVSLVEVLVAALILVLIITTLVFTLIAGQSSNTIGAAKTDLQAQVRRIMDWMVKDVRQTSLIQVNNNAPSHGHIKFKTVTGIDNATGDYTLSTDYIEYTYDSDLKTLTRSLVDDAGTVLQTWVFDNITEPPFHSNVDVELVAGGVLDSGKLVIVIAAEKQAKVSLTLNFSLTEEVKIRNE